jgi:microcystin degradation protein MlrC
VLRCRKERFHVGPRQAVASPSAASCHETNTFQPQLTTYADFAEAADRPPLTRGNALLTGFDGMNTSIAGALSVLRTTGATLLPVTRASTTPAG